MSGGELGLFCFNANVFFRWKEEMRKKGFTITARCREQAEAIRQTAADDR